MNESRKNRLAKLNGKTTERTNELISTNIRKDYSQSQVEAILCNALEDIVNALENGGVLNVESDHMNEFKAFLEYRKSTKTTQKEVLK